ncbi:MAG: spore cortex biosynthesis protein YabQ [Blautia sp.]
MSEYMHGELLFFLRIFLAGIFLAAVYDIFRILRNVMPHNDFFINMEDLIYWCGAGLFLFSVIYLENDGVIRVYAFAGLFLGTLLYHTAISDVLVQYLSVFLSKLNALLKILLKPVFCGRKRLKFRLKRVRICICKQKSIRKIRKNQNEKKKEKKSAESDCNV